MANRRVTGPGTAFPEWRPPIDRNQPGKPVLDLEKLNLGTSQLVPAPGGNSPANGDLIKLLDVTGDDTMATAFTVIMGSTFLQPEFPVGKIVTGPLTGLVEFGNGAAFARVEFDIPYLSRIPQTTEIDIDARFKSPYFSGVSINITGSAIRAYVRNDNNFPPVNDGTVIIGVDPSVATDPSAFAHISYKQTFGSNRALHKTIVIACQTGAPFPAANVGDITIGVPPFSQSVRFPRRDIENTSLDVNFISFAQISGQTYQIAPGSEGPLQIPPWCNEINVQNSSPVNDITSLMAVFELVI